MKAEHTEDEGADSEHNSQLRTVVLVVCACCGKRIAKAQGIKRLIFERGKTMDSIPLRRLLSVRSDANYCILKVLAPKQGNAILEIRVRITLLEIAKVEQLGIVQVNKCEMVNLRFVHQYKKGSHLHLEHLPNHPFEITDKYVESVDARMQPWRNL